MSLVCPGVLPRLETTVDELESHGLIGMDDAGIRGFLSSQSTGVLGLPGEDAS